MTTKMTIVRILCVPGMLMLGGLTSAFAQLPEGPGKDTVVTVCGTCHQATTAGSVRLTRAGWQATIGEMVARGARASDDDLNAVLNYLATYFLGEADKPLNLNTATAIELESVLELLRKEASALLAYRDKRKGFKSLADLRNIPGVPYKKIEKQKDRLVFGLTPPKPAP